MTRSHRVIGARPSHRRRWPRLAAACTVVVASVLAGAPMAAAAPATPSPSSTPQPPQTPGTAVCTVTDDRVRDVSGLAVVGSGFLMMDSGDAGNFTINVYHLDKRCSVTNVDIRQRQPRDPSDLGVGSGGVTYVADFGDASGSRPTIALWKLGSGQSATIFRMSYPDGAKDARALLLTKTDSPIVVTTTGDLYAPSGALKAEMAAPGVALAKVGHFTAPPTDTANPLGIVGSTTITGAAVSPDGSKVVIRTFADAYEWDVGSAGIVAAITTTKPRRTPLPNELAGEAIAYGTDGKSFYTVSLRGQGDGQPTILRYTPFVPSTAPPATTVAASGSWWSRLTLNQLTLILALFAVLGTALLGAGVFGLWQHARASTDEERSGEDRRRRHPSRTGSGQRGRAGSANRYADDSPHYAGRYGGRDAGRPRDRASGRATPRYPGPGHADRYPSQDRRPADDGYYDSYPPARSDRRADDYEDWL